ncbi:hypothetical protein [Mesobaculum littorinae]|nr:hypothetical protein [Mesobaculum littorinae]
MAGVSLHVDTLLDTDTFHEWFGQLLQDKGRDTRRLKGSRTLMASTTAS